MSENTNKELHAVVLPNGSLTLEWQPTSETTSGKSKTIFEEELYKRFENDFNSFLLFLSLSDQNIPVADSLGFWRNFTGRFADKLRHTPDIEILRDKAQIVLEDAEIDKILSDAPLMIGGEYMSPDLLTHYWKILNKEFVKEIKSYQGTIEEFIQTYNPDNHLIGRVFFHLVENKNSDRPFAFLATYSTTSTNKGSPRHLPLQSAIKEYGEDSEKLLNLLSTVYKAAEKSIFISNLIESGEIFHPLSWDAEEAFSFLKETPDYDRAGILCRIPNWWKGKQSTLKLNIRVGGNKTSLLGMNTLLDFDARLYVGDVPVSEKEMRELLKNTEGLAFIKNKWVPFDPEKLKETLKAYENAKAILKSQGGLTLRDALRMQLEPQRIGSENKNEVVEITQGEWLESVIQKLLHPEKISSVKPDPNFKARLRDYQQKGLNWLCFLHSLQLGACLADDMGLGKTIQILAFLNFLKSSSPGKTSLLILPASLISNWLNEIEHFCPQLKFLVAHPSYAGGKLENPESVKGYDLIISTYSMSRRQEWFGNIPWLYVILDEAQAIKNPGSDQAKAVKRFSAFNKIIMTGTPIENSVSDLWSLFDFLNPGLLGNAKEFKQFAQGLKDNPDGYARLRKVISPYILRRLKTDKSVITDLPDKVEMKIYSALSKKQIALYQDLVDDLKEKLENTEGINRKGLILASLMKFKQICNHPDQYTGGGDFAEDLSGKFTRLREICETIYEKREKVLLFTQFKEITEPISIFLAKVFQHQGLILHGGVPVPKRKIIIDRFMQDHEYVPYMVLSLKAGGVGLNLTQANHVFHFDRWWNPAVENQATDRAFRIGQKKNVLVHKFITKGTIEEKIEEMLEEKSKLSAELIHTTDESWITEMDNKRVLDLFKLTL